MAINLITIVKLGLAVTFLSAVLNEPVTMEAAVTCNQVVSYLSPCVSYLNSGGNPSSNCCYGVKHLNMEAQTTPDRQSVCRCLKSLLDGVKYNAQNVANAASLPGKCGVQFPYAINPNIDCSTIKM